MANQAMVGTSHHMPLTERPVKGFIIVKHDSSTRANCEFTNMLSGLDRTILV